MAEHNNLGQAGETAAAAYLTGKGFEIVARNYRFRRAEVDLIALQDKVLVFAEVKTRGSNKHGFPEDFVSPKKQELLFLAAEEFSYQLNWPHEIRFDILAVSVLPGGRFQIHHIEDAFH